MDAEQPREPKFYPNENKFDEYIKNAGILKPVGELVEERSIKSVEFEKLFLILQTLTSPLKLGKKMRIIVEYDPQKPHTNFKYFKIEE